MTVVELVVCLLVLLIVVYLLHGRDVMSPTIVLITVYLLSFMISFVNWDSWDMDNYSKDAVTLILTSVLVFAGVGVLFSRSIKKYKKGGIGKRKKGILAEIKIRQLTMYANSIVCILTECWLVLIALRARGSLALSLLTANSELSVPSLLSLLQRYVLIQGYFFGFIFVNNLMVRKFRLFDVHFLIAVITPCVHALVLGTRLEILRVLGFMFIASYVLWNKKNGWQKTLNGKYALYAVIGLCIMLVLFYQMRYFKFGDSSEFSPMQYISMYLGASVKLFDLYMKRPVAESGVWGAETFTLLNSNLATFGMQAGVVERHLEFRGVGIVSLGNVYGAIRRYYQDFGMSGVIILVCVLSLIIHGLYYKVKYSRQNRVNFECILYCYLFPAIPLFPIDDVFFSNLSIGYALNIAILLLLYCVFIKRSIRFRWK